MLYDQSFHPTGSDENDFEIVTTKFVHILMVDELYSIIFFNLAQNSFVRAT